MCYALPGPRCSNHAKEAKDKAQEEFETDPSEKNKQALKDAISEYLETPDGIALLRKKGREEEASSMERIRQRRLDAYNASLGKNPRSKTVPGTLKDKLAVASSPNTSADVLAKLAKDRNSKVREAVAGSTVTPAILHALAKDGEVRVLRQVAKNEHTEAETLTAVFAVGSKDSNVVGNIAKNQNCPTSLYPSIVAQRYPAFSQTVVAKQDCPQELIEDMATSDQWHHGEAVAESPRASVNQLRTLATDENKLVRRAVANNPLTPSETLQEMSQVETEFTVSEALRLVIGKRQS